MPPILSVPMDRGQRGTVGPSRYGGAVRLATWNVNSAKARLPRLLDWLDTRAPDVVCLQETKLPDAEWDATFKPDLDRRGYAYVHVGEGRWNGVAILSRVGLDDVTVGFTGQPGFPDPAQPAEAQGRLRDLRRPAGVERLRAQRPHPGRPALRLQAGLAQGAGRRRCRPTSPDTVVCGDMNIAPADADVWDIRKFGNSTHVTPEERAALAELEATGLADVVRLRWPDAPHVFSYWDYRAGAFHQDLGMRIDLVLAGSGVQRRLAAAWVDRQARKGSGPSDHAPVMVDLDEAPDGDIGPVVPPPSAPRRLGASPTPWAASRASRTSRLPSSSHRPAGVALVEGLADRERPPAEVEQQRGDRAVSGAVALQLAAQLGQRRRRSRPAPAPRTRPARPPSAGSPPARRACRGRARRP